MKNISLFGSLLVVAALLFTACNDETDKVFETFGDGALPVVGAVAPNFFDFADINAAFVEFSLDTEGAASVSSIDIIGYHTSVDGTVTGPGVVATVSPGSTVNITAADAASGVGLSVGDIQLKDVFDFYFEMESSEGRLKPGTKVNVPVSCPSDLAGMYEVVTTYAQHDFLPDYPDATIMMEVVQEADGVYSVADVSGGLYSEGPYVDNYGTTGVAFTFTEICGELVWTNQTDPWQNLLPDDNNPSMVTGDGTFTLAMIGDVYGESWVSEYTKQ